MRTIFLIDDDSPQARNAAALALQLAQMSQAKIVLGKFKSAADRAIAYAGRAGVTTTRAEGKTEFREQNLPAHLNALYAPLSSFNGNIEELDIGEYSSDALARFINQNETMMIIKSGVAIGEGNQKAKSSLTMQAVLNKVNVPVCLVPPAWQPGPLRSVAYLTDLRYCRADILSHLLQLTTPDIAVYVTHMALDGVADLAPDYAARLFSRLAGKRAKSARLFLHHIKDHLSIAVADVLVNSMDNDAVVLTNHSAHFRTLIGHDLCIRRPELIRVPIFLYPA